MFSGFLPACIIHFENVINAVRSKDSSMVVIKLGGKMVEGNLNHSSDTETHILLYNEFKELGRIVHNQINNKHMGD
ncbi:class II aldolase/adducin family protein [Clostridium sp.]